MSGRSICSFFMSYSLSKERPLTAPSSKKAAGTGGHATEEKDSAGSVSKAKKEHPEAPDPAIGMQDERGGRGA
jgi:hypothetical protein